MKSFIAACAVSLALAAFNGVVSHAVKDHYYYQVTGTHIPVSRHAPPASPITIYQRNAVAEYRTAPEPCTKLPCAPHSSYKVKHHVTSLPKQEVANVLPITRVISLRNLQALHAGE